MGLVFFCLGEIHPSQGTRIEGILYFTHSKVHFTFFIASSGHDGIAKEERYVCEVVYNVLQKVNKDIQKTGTR